MLKLFKLENIKILIKTIGYFLTDDEIDEMHKILEKAIARIDNETKIIN